jgi:ATP diphosphatase
MRDSPTPSRDIQSLIDIMAALRTPVTGCPWDLEQTYATIAPYTIEEAYEVADAIERGDFVDLREELGDLLLQVVFHSRMAEEEKRFDFGSVVEAVTQKMIRRHPHVFGDTRDLSPREVKGLWNQIKAEEKRERVEARVASGAPEEAKGGALAGVPINPINLPALTRAFKLQEKASKVGFDWRDPHAVIAKIREEIDEAEAEIEAGNSRAVREEIGDLLFALANLARHLDVDPENALKGTNAKFERRFAHIEARLSERGLEPKQASLDEMDELWNEAKRRERGI